MLFPVLFAPTVLSAPFWDVFTPKEPSAAKETETHFTVSPLKRSTNNVGANTNGNCGISSTMGPHYHFSKPIDGKITFEFKKLDKAKNMNVQVNAVETKEMSVSFPSFTSPRDSKSETLASGQDWRRFQLDPKKILGSKKEGHVAIQVVAKVGGNAIEKQCFIVKITLK